MVADPKGCLRFLPYAHNRTIDEIPVRVKVSRTEPAKFEVYELTEEGQRLAKMSEPPLFETQGLLYNCKSGQIFSNEFPSLDLRIVASQLHKFKWGDYLNGKFKRANVFDERDNRYVSSQIKKIDNPHITSMPINDVYGLVRFFF